MKYRKYYCKYHGLDLSADYHVHHLDHNRENNHISNLVHLPLSLHARYHAAHVKYLTAIENLARVINPTIVSMLATNINDINSFMTVFNEVRDYLHKTGQLQFHEVLRMTKKISV